MSNDYTPGWVKGAPTGAGVYWVVSTARSEPWLCSIQQGSTGGLLLTTLDLALSFHLHLEASSIRWHQPVHPPALPGEGP